MTEEIVETSLDRIPTGIKIISRFSGKVVLNVFNDEEKTLREFMEENRRGFPTSKYYYLGE